MVTARPLSASTNEKGWVSSLDRSVTAVERRACSVTSLACPFDQRRSTSKPPRARSPVAAPFRQAGGKAGRM
jgi:hypothetical protein